MAKIQVLKGSETTIGPIGIADMGKGGVAFGQAVADSGKRLFDSAYKYAYEKEAEKGEEEARLAAISARDPKTNALLFPEAPDGMSRVAQQHYDKIAYKRYSDALEVDIKTQAMDIASRHEADPEGFQTEFGEYIEKAKAGSGKFAGLVETAGAITSKQFAMTLQKQFVEEQDERAYQNALAVHGQRLSDIESMASAGANNTAKATATALVESLLPMKAEFSKKMPDAYENTITNKAKVAFMGGQLQQMSSALSALVDDETKSVALNWMVVALREGKMKSVPTKMQSLLKQVGFDDKWFEQKLTLRTPDGKVYNTINLADAITDQLSNKVSKLQGTVAELIGQQRESENIAAIGGKLETTGNISSGESEKLLDAAGIKSFTDLMNQLPNLFNPPEDASVRASWDDKYAPVMNVLIRNRGPLPPQVTQMFESVDSMPASQINLAADLYQQVTRFQSPQGFTETARRGINEKTVAIMESVVAIRDLLGTDVMPEIFNQIREADKFSNDEKVSVLRRKLDQDGGTKSSLISDYVSNGVGKGKSEDERKFYRSVAESLLLVMDAPRVDRILETAADKIFKESSLIHNSLGRTRYAPERAYPDDLTFNDFMFAADAKLSLVNPELKLGKDTFLVPDRRESTALPVYYFVDSDKRMIVHNGKPLQIGSQYVVQKNSERANKSKAEIRAAARARREAIVERQKMVDEVLSVGPAKAINIKMQDLGG
jgi:hypothetical protein